MSFTVPRGSHKYLFLGLIFLIAVGNVSAKSCSDLCAEEGGGVDRKHV